MLKRPDVDSLMNGPLGRWLDQQRIVREAARKATRDRRVGVVVVVLLLSLFALVAFGLDIGTVAWGAVMLGALGLAWAQRPVSKAVKTVKLGVNDAIAEALGFEYECDCKPGTPFALARAVGLIPSHDRAHFEDRWSGSFGEIPFTLHEAVLEERRGSGKNKRWVTVFRGMIMSIGYKHRFHGTTLLVRDNAHRSFFGGKKDTITVDGLRLDYAVMTHPGFEDRFDIYTSDQVEARHLIDPLYVERLLALEKSYQGRDVATIFHEGSLVVAIKTGDMFESGSIDARDDRRRLTTTIDQFARIADLAEQLNNREPLTGS